MPKRLKRVVVKNVGMMPTTDDAPVYKAMYTSLMPCVNR
jgi:hypothetical protein